MDLELKTEDLMNSPDKLEVALNRLFTLDELYHDK